MVAVLRDASSRLSEAVEAREALLAASEAWVAVLTGPVTDLERRLAKDSSTSSKPPTSDSPYKKKLRDRSLCGRSGAGRAPALRARGVHRVPHRDAHRRPVR